MKNLLLKNGYLSKKYDHHKFPIKEFISIVNKQLQSFTLAAQLGIIRAAFFIGNNF